MRKRRWPTVGAHGIGELRSSSSLCRTAREEQEKQSGKVDLPLSGPGREIWRLQSAEVLAPG